jgi:hypothetical protein
VFHVELRQRPHVARAFNLSAEELQRRFVGPLRAGRTIAHADREWTAAKTRLTIYEGRELGPEEIGLGRGWGNVLRSGTDVTQRMLNAAPARADRPEEVDRLKERLLGRLSAGPIPLAEMVALAHDLPPGARASHRLGLAELAVWELLHQGAAELQGPAGVIERGEWERTLLSWAAWSQATTSSISLARSASEANR